MAKKKKTWKELDLVKVNTLKRYIREVLNMGISVTALKTIHFRSNDITKAILKEAAANAKEENLKTIMPRNLDPAIENAIGKRYLTLLELLKQIRHLSAVELGNLVKLVREYIEELKKKKD